MDRARRLQDCAEGLTVYGEVPRSSLQPPLRDYGYAVPIQDLQMELRLLLEHFGYANAGTGPAIVGRDPKFRARIFR